MENSGILLVDDECAYHAIVSALLSRSGTIDCVDNGVAAIEAVRLRHYDLILLDMEMPARDGFHVITDIRASSDWARVVPIIAFTTLRPAEGEQHFIDRGFDGWLAKPFVAADLFALVGRWLGDHPTIAVAKSRRLQLAELLGREQAEAMIDRMLASLGEAVAEIDAGGDERALGHSLGGLAGTLGFPALSAAWLSLQDSGLTVWPTVRAMTLEAIDRLGSASAAAD